MDPYKNVATLVKAFAIILNDLPDARLVIAGEQDNRYPETGDLARRLGISDNVTWTGYLPDNELVELYRNASLLVHPSRYEGFGLQVAEAMASGTPVVCSNAGSVPEVVGEAAIMLDPDDVNGFAARSLDVLTNEQLAGDMIAKGLEQSARFTWKSNAIETMNLYAELE
jgi:glycosyltransferase involved in cell wall biosynthesis